jgi:selenocysteine lyase/cysteine desulfurase
MRPICEIVHRYGARLVVDAAQLVAHRKISVADDGIDCLAFSGHKIYAPFGAGVLVVKKGLPEFPADQIKPVCLPGEENAAGIAALGKALELMQQIGMEVIEREERELTLKLLSGLSQIKGIKVHGVKGPESYGFGRKAGVVAFDAGKIMSNVVARQLSLNAGIGIRNGCHCAHIIVKHILGVSPGLERFQHRLVALIPSINLPGVARVSLGIENDEKDVDRLLDAVKGIVSKQTGNRMAVDLPEVKRQIKVMANEEVVKIFGNG